MFLDLRRPSAVFDQVFESEQERYFVRPVTRQDPDHPECLYLEYGVKAQNYHDTTAFWREFANLQLPEDDYTMLLMEHERKQSLHSQQHPFLPTKHSIYAETAVAHHLPPVPDVPLSDYVRGSRDGDCIAPSLIFGDAPLPVASTSNHMAYNTPVEPEPLCEVAVDFSGFTFGAPAVSITNDFELALPPTASSYASSSSSRSECSTPATTPGYDCAPLPQYGAWGKPAPAHRGSSFSAPSPSSSGSDDEYDDAAYAYERAPKRKRTPTPRKAPAARKAPAKRARTDAPPPALTSASAPAALGDGEIAHPPLPTEPNARGRWACPYAGCAHETSAFGDLQRHLESLAHTPERRHRCATCGCAFTRTDALKRHQVKRPERCKAIARGLARAT